MFLCFSDLPLLCLPSRFFGHFCLETYVRVRVFSCACDHVFTHWVMCKCTCVNEISCELLTNQHIRPLCHSCVFFHVMIQCALDVVRVYCIEWEMEVFTYCLLYYCCTWRSSCQNSDNFVFIYCRLWIALQYCLWIVKALAILEREETFSIIWSKNLVRYTVCKTRISVPN